MASVSYRINGQADLTPIQKAKKEMSALDKEGKKFKSTLNTLKVTAAVAAIKKLTGELLACEEAFAEAERVTARIDFATKLNPTLNRTSKQLEDFANKTSKTLKGAISVDEINEQIAKLSFDKTGDEIEKIIDVAKDLSGALGTTLDDAVTQLNNTLAGNVGQLGKVFPELKNLSKESLAAGDAIDVISGKVKGMGEALAQTTSGSLAAYKNAMDDLKETLGRATTNFFTPIRNYITDIITSWNEATNAILNYKDAQDRIKGGTGGFEDYRLVWEKAQQELADFENNFTKMTGKNGETIYYDKTQKYSGMSGIISGTTYFELRKKLSDEVMRTGKEYDYARLAAEAAAKTAAAVVTTTPTLTPTLTPTPTTTSEKEDVNYWIRHAVDDLDWLVSIPDIMKANAEKAAEEAAKRQEALKSVVTSSLGDFGVLISSGPFGLLLNIVTEISSAIYENSSAVKAIMNFSSYIIDGIAKPIAKFLEASLSPLIPSLNNLIKLLNLVVKVISPIAEYIIGPIFKIISTIATSILVPIHNAVVAIHNFLTPKKKHWETIDLKKEVNGIWNGTSASLSGGSSSSSYTAAKDVYVNITFSHSYVNGDAREIALALKREMTLAERLGY